LLSSGARHDKFLFQIIGANDIIIYPNLDDTPSIETNKDNDTSLIETNQNDDILSIETDQDDDILSIGTDQDDDT